MFSTLLSLWNRKLVGEGHGVFGKGAFPGTVNQADICIKSYPAFLQAFVFEHVA